jgi:hypothetical protein
VLICRVDKPMIIFLLKEYSILPSVERQWGRMIQGADDLFIIGFF